MTVSTSLRASVHASARTPVADGLAVADAVAVAAATDDVAVEVGLFVAVVAAGAHPATTASVMMNAVLMGRIAISLFLFFWAMAAGAPDTLGSP